MKAWPEPTIVEFRTTGVPTATQDQMRAWLNQHGMQISDILDATPRKVGVYINWKGECTAYFLDKSLAALFKLTFANL